MDNNDEIIKAAQDFVNALKDALSKVDLKSVLDVAIKASASNIASKNSNGGSGSDTDTIKELTTSIGNVMDGKGTTKDTVNVLNDTAKLLGNFSDLLGPKIAETVGGALGSVAGALGGPEGQAIMQGIDLLSKNSMADIATGVWKSAASTLTGLFDNQIGSIFGLNGNMEDVAKYTAKLTGTNEVLAKSITDLKESIDKSNGAQTIVAGVAALDAQKQKNQNDMDILRENMGAWENGSHSNSYHWGRTIKDDEYKSINETLTQQELLYGPYKDAKLNTVHSLDDVYKLTPEQLKAISEFNPAVWEKMRTVGYMDDSKYWDAVVADAGQLEAITQQISTNLMQVSFDGLRDNFVDMLMDMESKSGDFTENITKTLQKALLNATIGNKYDKRLQDWYNGVVENMQASGDGTLSTDQIAQAKDDYEDIVDDALGDRNTIAGLTGYGSEATTPPAEARTASFGASLQSMTQDTADALSGTFTEIQSQTYDMSENMRTLTRHAGDILNSVMNIDHSTSSMDMRMGNMESALYGVRSDLSDIAMKGVRIRE